MVTVKFKKLNKDAKMPTKATDGSACWDLYAAETKVIGYSEVVVIGLGIGVDIPKGYFLEIRARSGLSSKGIVMTTGVGTVDEDYKGELKAIMHIVSGKREMINKGDRIAQCRLVPVIPIEWVEVETLSETKRGANGLGSSGR